MTDGRDAADGAPRRVGAPTRGARRGVFALRSTRWVLAAAVAVAALVLAALLTLALWLRSEALSDTGNRNELWARVLAEQATRSVESVSLALAALADTLSRDPNGALGVGTQGGALAQTLAGLPALRALAVVDATTGEVLASTSGDTGRRLDLARLGALPVSGSDRLGGFVPGRGFAALMPGPSAAAPPGVGFLPLVRNVGRVGGRTVALVGLVNSDALANEAQRTVDANGAIALLTDWQGRVLAATLESPMQPGASIGALAPYRDYLPRIEHGVYSGTGVRPERQILAFRASRTRALVAVVEQPEHLALAEWRVAARGIAGVALFAAGVIAALAALSIRTLATREAARRQRDAAQAAVAQREQELSVVVRSVQELLFRTDAAGALTFVNPRWTAATGLAHDALPGRLFASLVDASSAAAAAALFAPGAPEGLRTATVEIAQRRFDVAVAPLLEGTRISGFAGSAVDVTERDRAAARLREQNAFSALLIDTMPLPLSLLDREGRYVTVNRAWETFTGRWRDAVIGTRARSYLPPEEAALHDAVDRRLLTEGGQTRYETGFTHRDGSRRQLAITKAAVPDASGRPAGVLVCLSDISELREAERATREARDAAEEASRAKSEFIANISHELRTPLQSIIGFSELGQMRGREQPRLAGMFADIHASGQRMLALVNDLLDVAKIESTVGTFHLERTDVRPLVREVARELEPLLAARRLHIEAELGDVPLVAKVDPLRFQQVVRNVLANAVKFSPERAPIDLRSELTADNRIEISVRDRGPGIPPGEIEKIFEAFVQSSKTKDGSGGTGLGLAICRKIVEAHGGTIGAENVEGGGSRFTITLPARGWAETVV